MSVCASSAGNATPATSREARPDGRLRQRQNEQRQSQKHQKLFGDENPGGGGEHDRARIKAPNARHNARRPATVRRTDGDALVSPDGANLSGAAAET